MCGNVIAKIEAHRHFKLYMVLYNAEPQKGHFLSDIFRKEIETRIRTEIKTKNISFNRLIISVKRDNKTLKRYKIE